jgi:hypothetical protein
MRAGQWIWGEELFFAKQKVEKYLVFREREGEAGRG